MENFWFTKDIMLEVLQLVTGPVKKKVGKFYYLLFLSGSVSLILLSWITNSKGIANMAENKRLKVHTWNET